MSAAARRAIIVCVLACAAATASAEQRVRPPQFESDHAFPTTASPPASSDIYHYVDLAVLVTALAVGSYFAVKKRSRRWVMVVLVFSLLYFGFWRAGCICPVGSVQNVSRGLFDSGYTVPLVVVGFFVLPLIFTLLFGRTFCAAVCPLGAVQELVAVRPVRIAPWIEHAVGLVAYVYLAAAVLFAAMGSAYIICRIDPFVPLFRILPISNWFRAAVGNGTGPGGIAVMSGKVSLLIPTAIFLLVGVFIARPYCRFLCPLGAILRVLSIFSKWHVTITPAECVRCRLCENACPYGAIPTPTPPRARPPGRADRVRLAALLAALPLLTAAGALGGWAVSGQLARMDYTVRLARRVAMEQAGLVSGQTGQSNAFSSSGRTVGELYDDAQLVEARYATGAMIAGAFVGLVVGVKLISLSVYRRRDDYAPDRGRCLSCGRCFAYCPVERQGAADQQTPELCGGD